MRGSMNARCIVRFASGGRRKALSLRLHAFPPPWCRFQVVREAVNLPVHACVEALHASAEPLLALTGLSYACNEALHGYNGPLLADNA